jgi:hypothetical protein
MDDRQRAIRKDHELSAQVSYKTPKQIAEKRNQIHRRIELHVCMREIILRSDIDL